MVIMLDRYYVLLIYDMLWPNVAEAFFLARENIHAANFTAVVFKF